MYDIAIVGGGAAGLAAATGALKRAGALKVVILERLDRVGKKLLATGNGRCNLTNTQASPENYHGGVEFMAHAMRAYPPRAVIAFFQSLGVEPLYEPGGRVYPFSEQAGSVLDALRLSAGELGAQTLTGFHVSRVKKQRDGFSLEAKDGRSVRARRVLIASGGLTAPNLGGDGSGYALLASLGHSIVPCLPALVQLKTPPEPIRALKGIRYTGGISAWVQGRLARAEQGDVLFTEYGLSGTAVMQLSRAASCALSKKQAVEVRLQILPGKAAQVAERLSARREALAARPLEDFLTGWVNKRLGQTLLKQAGCGPLSTPGGALSDAQIERLAALLTGWTLPVTGTQGFSSAQATAGGADTREFDPDTMGSRICPGLYAAGEVLDVDGDCGGFNLQWAWASALTAARAMAAGLSEAPKP